MAKNRKVTQLSGDLTEYASQAERYAEKFEIFAEAMAKSSAIFVSDTMAYRIGGAIFHAWSMDLLASAPAIKKVTSWAVSNPPPAESKKTRSMRSRASGRSLRSQSEMTKEAISTEVFNLLCSTGEIEAGRVGWEQLCQLLAKVVLGLPKEGGPEADELDDDSTGSETAAKYRAIQEKGRKGAAKTNETYKELQSKYQCFVDSAMDQGRSYTEATDSVANTCEVSGRTVRNHTVNPDTS